MKTQVICKSLGLRVKVPRFQSLPFVHVLPMGNLLPTLFHLGLSSFCIFGRSYWRSNEGICVTKALNRVSILNRKTVELLLLLWALSMTLLSCL